LEGIVKRFIILCDGTWNLPDKTEDGIPVPTNVVKLAEAILDSHDGIPQLLFYDPGIGSSGSRLKRAYDGATGTGISANIQQAYRFLIREFEVGDQIFLLGFSRGAFTVRSLAGLIRSCGILRRNVLSLVPEAFALYRSRRPATHPRAREATLFRRTYAVEDVTPIAFIGVWDTVGSLGNPLYLGGVSPRNAFHDTALSSYVKAAYQALAVDETRRNFTPTLWHQQPGASGQILEQRWFAGVHSNIGGGYPDTGLSDLALLWLASKAKEAGLGHQGIAATPNPTGILTESRTRLYRLVPKRFRPIDAPTTDGPTHEVVDESVLTRYRLDSSYRPPNLVAYLGRHPELLR
jgi:uncharacterized protein (DUF2235 family)